MHLLDGLVVVLYLAGTVAFGAWFSRRQHSVKDYFVGGRRVPWPAIMGSIVATETSTVTFISVPGVAYSSNLTFLQLVVGDMLGRVIVSVFFVPAYFRGELLTVYQILGTRFGGGVKRLAAGLFLATRSLADGVRLFATGLLLAALLLAMPGVEAAARAWLPWVHPALAVIILSVILMGITTIAYTYLGGMSAVIWTDVAQLVIYLAGAIVAAIILLDRIPGGWAEVVRVGSAAGKFTIVDFTWDITKSYTFWSGVIGGAFLTTATHGTDQLMVQRYLCGRSERDARLALLTSGVVVFVQFVLFLLIGVMLYVFYTAHAPQEAVKSAAASLRALKVI
jgi:Na+/proline symporter